MWITKAQSAVIYHEMQSLINQNQPFDIDFANQTLELRTELWNWSITITTIEEGEIRITAASSFDTKSIITTPYEYAKDYLNFLKQLPTN